MQAPERAAFRMAQKWVCLVLLLQSVAVWTTASATASAAAPAAAAAAGAGAAPGATAAAGAGAGAAAAGSNGTAAASGRAAVAAGGHTHKCTNAKLFSECRVHCEYVVEGKGAYFVFTDGEDGLPCKTRTLDGEVLDGACNHGLCLVKNGRAATEPGAPHAVAAGAAAGAAAAAVGTAAPAAGTTAPAAKGAAAANVSHPPKHKKA